MLGGFGNPLMPRFEREERDEDFDRCNSSRASSKRGGGSKKRSAKNLRMGSPTNQYENPLAVMQNFRVAPGTVT